MRVVTFAKNKFETLCSLFWILTIFKVALILTNGSTKLLILFWASTAPCPPHCDITKCLSHEWLLQKEISVYIFYFLLIRVASKDTPAKERQVFEEWEKLKFLWQPLLVAASITEAETERFFVLNWVVGNIHSVWKFLKNHLF